MLLFQETGSMDEESETTTNVDSNDSSFAMPKNAPSRKKRSRTGDATLEKAMNIINEAGGVKKNEFSGFGEHIANKLLSYNMRTRAHVQFEISKILFEADMKMLDESTTPTPLSNEVQDQNPSPSNSTPNSYADLTFENVVFEVLH